MEAPKTPLEDLVPFNYSGQLGELPAASLERVYSQEPCSVHKFLSARSSDPSRPHFQACVQHVLSFCLTMAILALKLARTLETMANIWPWVKSPHPQ